MRKKCLVLICIFVLNIFFANCAVQAASIDFESFMNGKVENIFPEKYDKSLSEMQRQMDQVVFIFREKIKSSYALLSKKDVVLNGYLVKALDRLWLVNSECLRLEMEKSPTYYSKKLSKYIRKLPNNYDQAAFSFLLSNISSKLVSVSNLAPTSRNALKCLNDISHQKRYCLKIAESKNFYKKIPFFVRPIKTTEDKISNLLGKLQEKFSLESIILAMHWISGNSSSILSSGANKIAQKAEQKLLSKIITGLKAEMIVGLEEDAVVAIQKVGDGYTIKQQLFNGRLRKFVKKYQKLSNSSQVLRFSSIILKLQNELDKLKNVSKNQQSTEVLTKMQKTLGDIRIITKLKLRKVKDTPQTDLNLFSSIDKALQNLDAEKLLQ